jgi:hypothetical protein
MTSSDGVRNPAPITVRWEPEQTEASTDVRLDLRQFEPGVHAIAATIDGDALEADNERFATLEVREHLRVGIIDQREFGQAIDLQSMSAGAWFRRALDPTGESAIRIDDIDPSVIEPVSLRALDAVIACRPDLMTEDGWQSLSSFVAGGGLLWIVPPSGQTLALWTDQARSSLGLSWIWQREAVTLVEPVRLSANQPTSPILSMLHGELADLGRPVVVRAYLPIIDGIEPGGAVLHLAGATDTETNTNNGDPAPAPLDPDAAGARASKERIWMAMGTPDGAAGLVVYLASPPHLDWTSLPAKPIMVALTQETIRQGLSTIRRGRIYEPGSRPALQIPASSVTIREQRADVADARGDLVEYPIIQKDGLSKPTAAIRSRGIYEAIDSSGSRVGHVAVNVDVESALVVPQRRENVLTWLEHSGDWDWLDTADPASALLSEDSRAEFSLLLLALALILAVVETILARRFSHAYQQESTIGLNHGKGIGPTLGLDPSGQAVLGAGRTRKAGS